MYWYTREKADQDANEAAELHAVKQREEDLMAEVRCMRWLAQKVKHAMVMTHVPACTSPQT